MPETMLRIEGLSKYYGKFTAINDLSLELKEGEIFGFLGPNGAGKTTTIKVCTGLLKPTRGRVVIDGFDILKQPVEAKARIGYVPDSPFLYNKLTGREFVRFVARLYNSYHDRVEQRIQDLFHSFEMSDKIDNLIQSYSRGMRQKTAMIAAVIHNPKILFADEPTASLDPRSARLTKDIFRALARQGVTVFMSTHTMKIAERLCDHIGIIHEGKLIAMGTLTELERQTAMEGSTLEDIFFQLTGNIDEDTAKLLQELGA